MFQYRVKSYAGSETYLDIVSESEDVFEVLIVTLKDGYDVQKRETMTRKLFDSCVRTGYLSLVTDKSHTARKSA